MSKPSLPPIVTQQAWKDELSKLREHEKQQTRLQDELNAARRRLPMVALEKDYILEGPDGLVPLLTLFQGRAQLIVYHFMFAPDWEAGCSGCSWVVDAMSHPAHLHARDTSLALVSRAPLDKLLAYQQRMDWQLPWYSSGASDFNYDMGATNADGEQHAASVFIRDGEQIYRSYFTDARGVEYLGSHWSWLDLTPYGRQESWEQSPAGWPQSPPYGWIHRHDEYPQD